MKMRPIRFIKVPRTELEKSGLFGDELSQLDDANWMARYEPYRMELWFVVNEALYPDVEFYAVSLTPDQILWLEDYLEER